jgi:copper oxidase (laccase) domain-containing protein
MFDSLALSQSIPNTDIIVQVFNPGYGFRIDRNQPESLAAISDMTPDNVATVHMPIPVGAEGSIANKHIGNIFSVPLNQVGEKYIAYAYFKYDGVILEKSQSYAITSADCPTIVMYGRDTYRNLHVVAAHAGRNSLLSNEVLSNGISVPGIAHNEMVIFNAVKQLTYNGVDVEAVHLRIYCGIRTGFYHHPDHPAHGTHNQALLKTCLRYGAKFDIIRNWDTGELDLYHLIKAQAAHFGVNRNNIVYDDIDTGNCKLAWASRRRPGSWEQGERNLVIVSRPHV